MNPIQHYVPKMKLNDFRKRRSINPVVESPAAQHEKNQKIYSKYFDKQVKVLYQSLIAPNEVIGYKPVVKKNKVALPCEMK